MKIIGTNGDVEAHQGDAGSIEQAYYRLPSDQRGNATIEVTQEQADALMQHPRSDLVSKTFMGCVLNITDATTGAIQSGGY